MARYLAPLARHFGTRSLRERVLLTLALAALAWFVVDLALLSPAAARHAHLRAEIAFQAAEEARMQAESAHLQGRLAALAQARGRVAAQADLEDPLPDGEALAGLLYKLVQGGSGVVLESLRVPAARAVRPPGDEVRGGEPAGETGDADAAAVAPDPVYQHSVEFVLAGGYLDLLACLQRLEALPILLYWGDARLSVGIHPRATLSGVVHTFSHAPAVEFR